MSDSIPVRSVWVHVDEGKVIVETELEDGHYYEVISDFYGGDGCHVSHCVTSHGIREAQERGDLALWERVSQPAAGVTTTTTGEGEE